MQNLRFKWTKKKKKKKKVFIKKDCCGVNYK